MSRDTRVTDGWGASSPRLAATNQRDLYCIWKEAEIGREASAKFPGKTDLGSVKGTIASLEDRVTNLERKLAGLGRLVVKQLFL